MKMTSSMFVDSDIAQIVAGLHGAEQGFSGKTVLLAGAGGFLGRYFTAVFRHLNEKVLSKPCPVIAIDNFITSSERPEAPDADPLIRTIRHDVTEPLTPDETIEFVVQAARLCNPFYHPAYPFET